MQPPRAPSAAASSRPATQPTGQKKKEPATRGASQPATRATSVPTSHPGAARGLIHFPDFTKRVTGDMGRRLAWQPQWPRFRTSEWILSGTFGALALGTAILGTVGSHHDGGVGPDEDIRSALRLSSFNGRSHIRDASDVLLTTVVSYPFIDALAIAGWFRRSPKIATQMALINMEVYAVTLGVTGVFKSVGNRERPYGRICGIERPATTRDCDSSDRYYSFFSGHTSATFAAASVNCMHHMYLHLYGSTGRDVASCIAGYTLATATGLMRIMGDAHYFTDVATGAAVGTTIGLLLPWLLHYRYSAASRSGGEAEKAADARSFQAQLVPFGVGVGAVGSF